MYQKPYFKTSLDKCSFLQSHLDKKFLLDIDNRPELFCSFLFRNQRTTLTNRISSRKRPKIMSARNLRAAKQILWFLSLCRTIKSSRAWRTLFDDCQALNTSKTTFWARNWDMFESLISVVGFGTCSKWTIVALRTKMCLYKDVS